MTAFYIVIGIAVLLSLLTIISLARAVNKNRQDWRGLESGENSKHDWREVEPGDEHWRKTED